MRRGGKRGEKEEGKRYEEEGKRGRERVRES